MKQTKLFSYYYCHSMYLEAVVVDSLAHVVCTNSINLQHYIKGAYNIQTTEIHTLSVLHIYTCPEGIGRQCTGWTQKISSSSYKMAGKIHYAHKDIHNAQE